MEEKVLVFDFQNEPSARECRKNYYFAIFNLMNAIVGAGMLSLSFAVKVR
jgi:amino acid permease